MSEKDVFGLLFEYIFWVRDQRKKKSGWTDFIYRIGVLVRQLPHNLMWFETGLIKRGEAIQHWREHIMVKCTANISRDAMNDRNG